MSFFDGFISNRQRPQQTPAGQQNSTGQGGENPAGPGGKNPANGANGVSGDNKNVSGADGGPNLDEIWNDVQKSPPQNAQQPQNSQNNPPPVQQTPEEKVAAYLKQQGLDPIELTDADADAIKNGDFSGVMGRLNEKIANSHIKAVNAANALINDKLPKMVEEAVKKANGYTDTLETRKFIRNDPKLKALAENPIFAPNVEAIFKQLQDKGATLAQAAQGTVKYFERLSQAFNPDAQVNPNRGGPYRTPQNSGDIDWLDLLGSK